MCYFVRKLRDKSIQIRTFSQEKITANWLSITGCEEQYNCNQTKLCLACPTPCFARSRYHDQGDWGNHGDGGDQDDQVDEGDQQQWQPAAKSTAKRVQLFTERTCVYGDHFATIEQCTLEPTDQQGVSQTHLFWKLVITFDWGVPLT